MQHTKFRGNRPAGSREEDFRRVFTINGHCGHLGHVTSIMSSDLSEEWTFLRPSVIQNTLYQKTQQHCFGRILHCDPSYMVNLTVYILLNKSLAWISFSS